MRADKLIGSNYKHDAYFLMYRVYMILFFFLFFASKSVFSESSIQRTTILKLQNDTEFSVVIQRGFYGGSDVTTLSPHEKKEIEVQHILIDSDEIVFYYYFDVNYNSLSINGLKSNQQNFTVKPFEKEHTEVIAYPDDIEFYNIAIIIENRSDKSISLAKNNSFIELYQYGKNIGISVPPSSSASFIKTSSELNGGISIYGSDLTFPVKEFENKYIYTFEFDGESVKLKDYRPILQIGEATWEIPVANSQKVKFIRFNEYTQNTYIVGEDTTNSEKSQCFIQIVDNQGNIVKYDTEEFANCVFTDIIFYKDSLIVAAQNKDLQTPPFLIEFDNTGKRTGLLTDFSDLSSIDALYKVNEEQFYISGTSSGKDKIIILPVKYGNNLLREKKLFELSCDLNPKNYKSCYG